MFISVASNLGSQSTGKERDDYTGLDYFLARYYSGAQGRFLSPDEFKGGIADPFTGQDIETNTALPYADITDPQTLNKYDYVRNNPLALPLVHWSGYRLRWWCSRIVCCPGVVSCRSTC
jgi:RHS repeat-associated protein